MINKNVTTYLDEETYKNLKIAKSKYSKSIKRPDSEVKMSEFVRDILRGYLKINKRGE